MNEHHDPTTNTCINCANWKPREIRDFYSKEKCIEEKARKSLLVDTRKVDFDRHGNFLTHTFFSCEFFKTVKQ